MLEVIIENSALDLEADTGISVTATNPMLDKDGIGRAFSFPFSLPISPRNARLLGHRNRLDAVRQLAKQDGKIRFQGHDFLVGSLTEKKSSNSRVEVAFTNKVLDIWKQLGEFKLTEILETLTIATSGLPLARWKFQLVANPATYTMSFPVPLGTVSRTAGSGVADRDIAGGNLAADIHAVVPGFATYFSGGELYLDGALMNLWPVSSFSGMSIVSAVSPGYRSYLNVTGHVNEVNGTPVDTHCFPVIHWANFYPLDKNEAYQTQNMVNAAADGEWFGIVKSQTEQEWTNTIVPMVRIPYILERIRVKLGMAEWQGEVWDDAEFQDLIVLNNYALDRVSRDYYDDLNFYNLNVFKQIIELNRHVPDITGADFIRALCTTFNLQFEAVGGVLSFSKKTGQLTQPPRDITALVAPDYAIERNDAPGWALKYKKDTDELHVIPSGHLTEITSGSGGVLTEVARTLDWITGVTLDDDGLAKVPVTLRGGISDFFDQKAVGSKMPLTFLFYRGLQNTSIGNPYPFASYDNLNYAGGSVGAYSLDIYTAAGLYEKWHKGHIQLTDADTINLTMRLTLGELQRLLRWQNARVRVRHPEGSFVGVVKSLAFSARKRGLSEVKIEVLRQ